MPQVFHVGYRSPWVSAVAWLLMALGLAGLGLLGFWIGSGAGAGLPSLRSVWGVLLLLALLGSSGLSIAGGQGLLRRYEWARRLCCGLLLALLLASPMLLWVSGSHLLLAALCLVWSAAILWTVHTLNTRSVRQEFA